MTTDNENEKIGNEKVKGGEINDIKKKKEIHQTKHGKANAPSL